MYDTETYKQPFWAENSGFMTGRDPLGIQNSSIALYAALLPGMTNLTLRLRYYGLYCWLLSEYDKMALDKGIKNLEHQYSFIRRAELTIAFLMLKMSPDVTSIVGSDYAGRYLQEFDDQGFFEISKGADKNKDTKKGTVYWDYSSGALGQYYAGSLIALDLVEVSHKFFIIRDKGKELSKAFEDSISQDARVTFLKVLESGILNSKDLYSLGDFRINGILKDSKEWKFYRELLLKNDGPRSKISTNQIPSNRKETIKLFLSYRHNPIEIEWFPEYQFRHVDSDNACSETTFGWYYYYLNEAIHYCIETIFWGMLVELDGKNDPINDFIHNICEIILQNHITELRITESDSLADVLLYLTPYSLPDELERLKKLNKAELNSKEAMGAALLLFFRIYKKTESNKKKIADFEKLYYLNFQKGNITEFFHNFIDDLLNQPYRSYLEKILKIIINDHITTAYRKMGNGESNLLKFVIEDGIIGHIQTMIPKFTNPRIQTLRNFMMDLGFIDKKEKPTVDGELLLKEIS